MNINRGNIYLSLDELADLYGFKNSNKFISFGNNNNNSNNNSINKNINNNNNISNNNNKSSNNNNNNNININYIPANSQLLKFRGKSSDNT
jgi:hypothetical protein